MPLKTKYFPIPGSNQILEIPPTSLKVFQAFSQGKQGLESGGLLFGHFELPRVILDVVTAPVATDKQGQYHFEIDSKNADKEIQKQFKAGHHFLGEWHTHPQVQPHPSPKDLQTIRNLFVNSRHELNAVIMIIVGSRQNHLSLWVSLHNQTKVTTLFENQGLYRTR